MARKLLFCMKKRGAALKDTAADAVSRAGHGSSQANRHAALGQCTVANYQQVESTTSACVDGYPPKFLSLYHFLRYITNISSSIFSSHAAIPSIFSLYTSLQL
jgi:hypothetical protein